MATFKERLKALASWAWKREGLSFKERFENDYNYSLNSGKQIVIHQSAQSLGTTVWDSSIVLSKFLERKNVFSASYFKQHPRCIELGSGCGLVGIVLSQLGPKEVVLTDMGSTMDLLKKNVQSNPAPCALIAEELEWGKGNDSIKGKFDLIVGTDIMYVQEATPALINTLSELSHDKTDIYFAYGRNRWAEGEMTQSLTAAGFTIEEIGTDKLDETYQSSEITVVKINLQLAKTDESKDEAEGEAAEEKPSAQSKEEAKKARQLRRREKQRDKKRKRLAKKKQKNENRKQLSETAKNKTTSVGVQGGVQSTQGTNNIAVSNKAFQQKAEEQKQEAAAAAATEKRPRKRAKVATDEEEHDVTKTTGKQNGSKEKEDGRANKNGPKNKRPRPGQAKAEQQQPQRNNSNVDKTKGQKQKQKQNKTAA